MKYPVSPIQYQIDTSIKPIKIDITGDNNYIFITIIYILYQNTSTYTFLLGLREAAKKEVLL